ncbi:MAG: RluA family pseudouridine synthase, partial [Eubacterium sp.]|nr:RluA family pseudouridine synthase [Eubacterium sp.]
TPDAMSASTGPAGSAVGAATGTAGTGASTGAAAVDTWAGISPLRAEEILYEDADILILVKPAGELSQKAKPEDISINERMLRYLRDAGAWDPSGTFTPSICNRLDRNTSGIILAGKSLPGTQLLSELIRERKIRKFYLTVVESDDYEEFFIKALRDDSKYDTIEIGDWIRIHGYLDKDEKTNKVTIYDEPGEGRAEIHTAYRIIEPRMQQSTDGADRQTAAGIRTRTAGAAPTQRVADAHTRLEVELITGKTHQIRAHLASIGHPLVGDKKYGSHEKGPYELTAYRVIFPEDERLAPELRGKEIKLEVDNDE